MKKRKLRFYLSLEWKPQDLWIGIYVKPGHAWLCLLPCLPLHLEWYRAILVSELVDIKIDLGPAPEYEAAARFFGERPAITWTSRPPHTDAPIILTTPEFVRRFSLEAEPGYVPNPDWDGWMESDETFKKRMLEARRWT